MKKSVITIIENIFDLTDHNLDSKEVESKKNHELPAEKTVQIVEKITGITKIIDHEYVVSDSIILNKITANLRYNL